MPHWSVGKPCIFCSLRYLWCKIDIIEPEDETMKLKEIINTLSELKPAIRERYNVKELGVFGSYARGQEKRGSDLDVLVSFEEPIGLFKFLEIEEYLSDKLDVKVDLVFKNALKPRIGKRILEQVIMV
jgi:hypothetical protein